MSLRIATGADGSVKERKGLKRKFKAYAGLAFGLILIAGLLAGCGKKDTADADVDLSIFAAKSLNSVMDEICAAYRLKRVRSATSFSQQEWHRWMSFRMATTEEAWWTVLVLNC